MIHGYLGEFGSGKTTNVAYQLLLNMYLWNRKVISNTPIEGYFQLPFRKKKLVRALFVAKGDQFLDALAYEENCDFFIDEASVFLPNHKWNKLPDELVVKWAQQRKYATNFYYTSQLYGHSVKRIRDLTHAVYLCRKRLLLPRVGIGKLKTRPVYLFSYKRFHPAYLQGTPTKKKYDLFYRGSRTLYPSQQRQVFRCFNTNYVIDMSAMLRLRKGFTQPKTKAELEQVNLSLSDAPNAPLTGISTERDELPDG